MKTLYIQDFEEIDELNPNEGIRFHIKGHEYVITTGHDIFLGVVAEIKKLLSYSSPEEADVHFQDKKKFKMIKLWLKLERKENFFQMELI